MGSRINGPIFAFRFGIYDGLGYPGIVALVP